MRNAVVVSTIVTPADDYDLIDLATLKTLLGVTATTWDAVFALWITQASTTAQNFTGNPFVIEARQDQIWPRKDGVPWTVRPDLNTLELARWPLTAVDSVVEQIAGLAKTLVAGTDFLADNEHGWLYRLDREGRPKDWAPDPVTVAYSAGYETIPADVVDAIASMVKIRWFAQTRDPMIRSSNIEGVAETSYWFASGPGADTDMPPDIQAKLERFRIPVVG
jgi:hypothetical protein